MPGHLPWRPCRLPVSIFPRGDWKVPLRAARLAELLAQQAGITQLRDVPANHTDPRTTCWPRGRQPVQAALRVTGVPELIPVEHKPDKGASVSGKSRREQGPPF